MKQRVIKKEKFKDLIPYGAIVDAEKRNLKSLEIYKVANITTIAVASLLALYFNYTKTLGNIQVGELIAVFAGYAIFSNLIISNMKKKTINIIEENEKLEQIFLHYYGLEAKNITDSDIDFSNEEPNQTVYTLK